MVQELQKDLAQGWSEIVISSFVLLSSLER